MPWNSKDNTQTQWLYASFYFEGIIGIVAIVCRKSKLDEIYLTQSQINRGGKILPLYLIICLALMVLLLIKSGVEKGKN